MAHLAFELFGTSVKGGRTCARLHLWFASPVSSALSSLISSPPPLEVFLNPAPLATCLCLFLPRASVHVSVCQPYLPLSPFPPPLSPGDEWRSVARQALQRGPVLRIGKCQSLTGGGGGWWRGRKVGGGGKGGGGWSEAG